MSVKMIGYALGGQNSGTQRQDSYHRLAITVIALGAMLLTLAGCDTAHRSSPLSRSQVQVYGTVDAGVGTQRSKITHYGSDGQRRTTRQSRSGVGSYR